MTPYELIPLEHIPVNPARASYSGEQVFLSRWQAWADQGYSRYDGEDCTHFLAMFAAHRWPAGQLEATVAASIICWLGTNCGSSFLREAKQLSETLTGHSVEDAFLMYWAYENSRWPHINRGIRLLESLMTPVQQLQDVRNGYCLDALQVEAPSSRAYEAAEHVVRWLANEHGLAFQAECVGLLYRTQVVKNLAQLEEAGLGRSPSAQRYREELADLDSRAPQH